MISIPLTQCRFALVDDDAAWLLDYGKWQFHKSSTGRTGYAVTYIALDWKRNGGKRQFRMFMHDLISRPPSGLEVDHRDGDGLNNQRFNLRNATRKQQCFNRGLQKNKSGYRGVSSKTYRFLGERWHAHIRGDSKQVRIGTFKTAENAAQAYNFAAEEYFGEFARFNVPKVAANIPVLPIEVRNASS